MDTFDCGICHSHSGTTEIYCASCVNFQLLKYRLNNIHFQGINQDARTDINRILDICFNDGNKDYLERYIQGKDLETIGDVSSDSVARLAFMLMLVDTTTRVDEYAKIKQMIVLQQREAVELGTKVTELKKQKSQMKERIQRLREAVELNVDINTAELVTKPLLKLQSTTIKNMQYKLLYSVLNWWDILELKGRLSIMSTPIIPVTSITKYNISLISESFLRTCQLVEVLSKVLRIEVAHTISTEFNELIVDNKTLKLRDSDRFTELSRSTRMKLSVAISKIIQNIITLLLQLDPGFRSKDLSLHDLLRYDQLVLRIVHLLKSRIQYDTLKLQQSIPKPPVQQETKNHWNWFSRQRHHNRPATASHIQSETDHTDTVTDTNTSRNFEDTLLFASLPSPTPLHPPTLPPAATDAWPLLVGPGLVAAIAELLVGDDRPK